MLFLSSNDYDVGPFLLNVLWHTFI